MQELIHILVKKYGYTAKQAIDIYKALQEVSTRNDLTIEKAVKLVKSQISYLN